MLRNMGVGLAHSLLAYQSTLRGISKLQVGPLKKTALSTFRGEPLRC